MGNPFCIRNECSGTRYFSRGVSARAQFFPANESIIDSVQCKWKNRERGERERDDTMHRNDNPLIVINTTNGKSHHFRAFQLPSPIRTLSNLLLIVDLTEFLSSSVRHDNTQWVNTYTVIIVYSCTKLRQL